MGKSASEEALAQEKQRDSKKREDANTKPFDAQKKKKKKKKQDDATTGVSAASARAVAARAVAFYFRAPVKAFFRTRVDYMAFARAINPRLQAKEAWSWRTSTPGILGHAVQTHGWSFIPKQVLPPLFANVLVGSVLYTSYLTTLSALHPPFDKSPKRPNPPPPPAATFAAGFFAGTLQSLLASPIDALHIRFRTADMLSGRYSTMWHYALHKTSEIGVRGIFAGWTLSVLKDSFGAAAFFCTFEWVKAQGFYSYVKWYYSTPQLDQSLVRSRSPVQQPLKPHFALEPGFLFLAGLSATFAQAAFQHPLYLLQEIHYHRLDSLDAIHSRRKGPDGELAPRPTTKETLQNYKHAYDKTRRQAAMQARRVGGWWKWAYRGFLWNTLRAAPSTSAGLIIFELVRRKFAVNVGDETEGGGKMRLDLDQGREMVFD